MEGGRANGTWAVTCDGLAGVGCCNSGIPRENTELKTGSANSVGKSPQPISIPISPNFPEFFPDFVFSPKIRYSIGKIGIRCRSVRDFPVPAFIPTCMAPRRRDLWRQDVLSRCHILQRRLPRSISAKSYKKGTNVKLFHKKG